MDTAGLVNVDCDDDTRRRWRLNDIEIPADYVSSSTIRLGARRLLRPFRGLEIVPKKKRKRGDETGRREGTEYDLGMESKVRHL